MSTIDAIDAALTITRPPPLLTDAWDFITSLGFSLNGEDRPVALMRVVRAAFLAVPEIESVWIGNADHEGRLVQPEEGGACPERHRALAERAWVTGQPETEALAAALTLSGQAGCHGLLVLQARAPGFLGGAWSVRILAHLAQMIGGALERCGQRAALARAQSLNRTLLAGIDHVLAARTEPSALRLLCKTLVDSGLFVSAGVGVVGEGGVHRHIAVSACRNVRVLQKASLVYRPGQDRRPLTFDAWEHGRTVVANTYFSNARFAPTHALAAKIGWKSIAALIIRRGGAPWGIISVTAAEEHFFDQNLIDLLERMTVMVGRVLDEIDLKAVLRAQRETQRRLAREDMLTALPNRRAFHEELSARMGAAAASGAGLVAALLDLNEFKQINDKWGHAAGDHILRVIGGRLGAELRGVDYAARLGGDEFALILDGFPALQHHDDDEFQGFCARLKRAVSAPVALPNGRIVEMGFCAGFAALSTETPDADALLRRADRALSEAKAEGGRAEKFWCVHRDRAMGGAWPMDIWTLLRNGALCPYFQPVLDLENGEVTTMEALARLTAGDEIIPPAKFLPHMSVEERSLLFCKILDAAVQQVAQLAWEGRQISVSVNLDGEVLLRERTLPFIKKVLASHGVPAERLVLEILETHEFFSLTQAKTRIRALKALGVRIALDDVGAGHSSLLKVRDLPLDIVKLDRHFVTRLAEQPDDLVFIATLQTLTATLRMKLIVEGAEDDVVMGALRIVGVRHVQGYGVARPMDGPALTKWLREYRPRQVSPLPASLLGAYALHANWLRAMEFCQMHEATLTSLLRSDLFCLGAYFEGPGARHAAVRAAYDRLSALMQASTIDLPAILAASLAFRHALIAALAQAPAPSGEIKALAPRAGARGRKGVLPAVPAMTRRRAG